MTTLTLVKKTSFTVASLATTILLSICTPVQAFMFGTKGIQFDEDTSINFTFDESHGSYQSSLWVAQALSGSNGYSNITQLFYEFKPSDNGSADQSKGTFGNSVSSNNGSITQTVTFLKDQTYALLLWSDSGTGKQFEQYVSSSTFMNSPDWFAANTQFRRDDCLVTGCQQAVFGDFKLDYNSSDSFTNINGGKGPEQYSLLTVAQLAQGTKISFDDAAGKKDADFENFIISAELAPEPVTVFGTMLGIGALAAARGKKKRQQQPEK
ncbi:PEP-CTERM sorting domain-containing protein [Microcoleus sp. A2-C5]|uniref:PEP-CTERM sorting domain-containing protein n=1 Tax=Microcoleaceae TaxID=1892252 RepID=UPI002238B9B1|nr:PEP-CTERM sorting domain-containing protein [Lyngbya sp. CCAP 1446/10]MCW6052973.1 PEP-CTERM sorting domain-containing protein [Lyngbya sp. CCAP 1446/10]